MLIQIVSCLRRYSRFIIVLFQIDESGKVYRGGHGVWSTCFLENYVALTRAKIILFVDRRYENNY